MKVAIKNLSQKLLKDQTDKTKIQMFRYLFVGGAAFLVDFVALYILTDFFGIYYLISAAIAFILGLITNYFMSISWVFNKRKLKNRHFEFGVFAAIGLVGLGLNEVFIWFFTQESSNILSIIKNICCSNYFILELFCKKIHVIQMN